MLRALPPGSMTTSPAVLPIRGCGGAFVVWVCVGPGGQKAPNSPVLTLATKEANAPADRSLVTRVGGLHGDHAMPGDRPEGSPTSSATLPSLVVRMLRHGQLGAGLSFLDLGTEVGGLTAYASCRIGERYVTSLTDDQAADIVTAVESSFCD